MKPMPSFESGPISWAAELIARVVGAWLSAIFVWSCIGVLTLAAAALLISWLAKTEA